MTLKPIYNFFGGFGETITVISLVALIVLTCFGKTNDSFAASLVAIGGWGMIHDQLTTYQDNKQAQQQAQQQTTQVVNNITVDPNTPQVSK